MKKIWIALLLTVGWELSQITAQTTLQVVSKNIEKTVTWKPGMELVINGEKADITVVPTDSARIGISAEMSAKHPSLDTARSDVETWQFLVSTSGKKIYLRAYVGVTAGRRAPVSNMKVRITISAPKACAIDLSNKFGRANLENLDGPMSLKGYFCRFDLQTLSGEIHIDTEHGAVDGSILTGPLVISGKRADVTLQKTTGDCTIKTEYGSVRLDTDQQTGNVRIAGQMTEVTIVSPNDSTHNYLLRTRYGTLYVPDKFSKSIVAENENSASFRAKNEGPTIEVETTFSYIKIEQ